ncbi:MAG: crossover junction endodeoxyribonuclease RuvC [Minisyncoccia bacterium]
MRILAIDPGYERLGIAIIDKENHQKEVLVFSECFRTKPTDTHTTRLHQIRKHIEEVVEKYQPQTLATETLYFSTNKKTALLVAEARGVILSTSTACGLDVFEYTPNTIKLTITGYGNADKKSIMNMIPRLISGTEKIKIDDEFDAIAIGITHSVLYKK